MEGICFSGDYFTCSIPADWSKYDPGFGLSQDEKKVYGLTLFGPQDESKVPPTISVHYYAPGNLLHKTMAKFIRGHSEPLFDTQSKGDPLGKVDSIQLAGRKATTFNRKSVRYIGERSLKPEKVVLFEHFVVVPDSKDQGFYVLELSVPSAIKTRYTAIFENVVKSFLPVR
ncbi:MAG: hypothetical protein KA801_08105 [Syntrophorhabdaceae bacterium]|nr:hypothetical protein [Syntrophorhabdaceae bacterium]